MRMRASGLYVFRGVMDFILVCTCISHIYFEHPKVYMFLRVIYRCMCTYVLIREVWFKSYVAPHL